VDENPGLHWFACPDGSFFVTIRDVVFVDEEEREPAVEFSKRSSGNLHVLHVPFSDTQFWDEFFSPPFLDKLEALSFGLHYASTLRPACMRSLLSLFERLVRPGGKPFNLYCGINQEFPDAECHANFIKLISRLICFNLLLSVTVPRVDGCPSDWPQTLLPSYSLLLDAVKATDTLKHLRWPGCVGLRDNGNIEECVVPEGKKLRKMVFDALKANLSLTSLDFYFGPSTVHSGFEELESLMDRNKKVLLTNVAISEGGDGEVMDECIMALAKQIVADKFNIHRSFFNEAGDKCFCEACHRTRGDSDTYTRGSPPAKYAIPVGWARLGLTVPEGFAEAHGVFRNWHVSYHGTVALNLEPIFSGNLVLLKPGDIAFGGGSIGVRGGHVLKKFVRLNKHTGAKEMFDPNQIFTSPSVRYASHDAYAPRFIISHPNKKHKKLAVRFCFQCRQRPGSYKTGQETVGAEAQGKQLDPHFNNNELERYTQESVGLLLHGLLVQIRWLV